MSRRPFIAVVALAFALGAHAQPQVVRVGVLEFGVADPLSLRVAAFKDGLRQHGYVEGRNLTIEYRWANGSINELARLATELVHLRVDVILAATTVTALAAREATKTIPIVFAVPADPVGVKLVSSLGRPGGNATGLTTVNIEVLPKRLEILKELSGATSVALIFNPADASNVLFARSAQDAAHALGMRVQAVPVKSADDFESTFAALAAGGSGAALVAAGALMDGHTQRIVAAAARARVPALYGAREYVAAGGLVSYSANFADNYRRAAGYVDRILKGAKPADLPVEQASKFDFVINVKAARGLGLRIAPGMLVRASEVID
jgi:putative tryptophan/tyrosine transport system substrate-binding protein